MDLKKSWEGYMGVCEERKGIEKCCNYNLKKEKKEKHYEKSMLHFVFVT